MRESLWLELDHIDSVLLLTAIRQAIAKSIVAFYQKYELPAFVRLFGLTPCVLPGPRSETQDATGLG